MLKQKIIDKIKSAGAISVGEYMKLCISHYYATRDPFGKDGDFVTAPEISQIFGELAGAWMFDIWQKQSSPKAILCEIGPGRGTLTKDALRATAGHGFHENIAIEMIESSPVLRTIQQQNLKNAHADISWHESLNNLPPLPLYLIANEFFDALPIEQYMENSDQRKVAVENGELFFMPAGNIVRETSPVSVNIIKNIAAHIKKYGGAALIVDYGYMSEEHGDSLQAMKQHAFVNILAEPGEADITAHVDFRALKNAAAEVGVATWGAEEQGIFLKRLGAELRAAALCKSAGADADMILSGLERLVAPHKMGSLFKVLALTSSLDKPAGF